MFESSLNYLVTSGTEQWMSSCLKKNKQQINRYWLSSERSELELGLSLVKTTKAGRLSVSSTSSSLVVKSHRELMAQAVRIAGGMQRPAESAL